MKLIRSEILSNNEIESEWVEINKEDFDWLKEQASQVKDWNEIEQGYMETEKRLKAKKKQLEKERVTWLNVAKYHQEKQKEAENLNEPYRHQNQRYERTLSHTRSELRHLIHGKIILSKDETLKELMKTVNETLKNN